MIQCSFICVHFFCERRTSTSLPPFSSSSTHIYISLVQFALKYVCHSAQAYYTDAIQNLHIPCTFYFRYTYIFSMYHNYFIDHTYIHTYICAKG